MRHGSHTRTPTVAEVVRRAVSLCDPDGDDELLADFQRAHEDRDEPVTALGERDRSFFEAAERLQGTLLAPQLEIAAAVATYIAFRRDELGGDDPDLLRLAARAEYGDDVPVEIATWLQEAGLEA